MVGRTGDASPVSPAVVTPLRVTQPYTSSRMSGSVASVALIHEVIVPCTRHVVSQALTHLQSGTMPSLSSHQT